MKKFVDLQTGHLHFENGAVVKENDTLKYVQGLNLASDSSVKDMKTGWAWLTVNKIPVMGDFLNVSFAFDNDKLKEITLFLNDNEFENISTEDFYSEIYQRKIHDRNKNWITNNIGQVGYYMWGNLYCGLKDLHGSSASMGIRYVVSPGETRPDLYLDKNL